MRLSRSDLQLLRTGRLHLSAEELHELLAYAVDHGLPEASLLAEAYGQQAADEQAETWVAAHLLRRAA